MWEHMDNPTDIEKGLNVSSLPRLQVVGKRVNGNPEEQIWSYYLIYKHFTEGVVQVLLQQQTRSSVGRENLLDEDGKIDPTMRIAADSKWDSLHMKLPLYYIADGEVEKVDLAEFKKKFQDKI